MPSGMSDVAAIVAKGPDEMGLAIAGLLLLFAGGLGITLQARENAKTAQQASNGLAQAVQDARATCCGTARGVTYRRLLRIAGSMGV